MEPPPGPRARHRAANTALPPMIWSDMYLRRGLAHGGVTTTLADQHARGGSCAPAASGMSPWFTGTTTTRMQPDVRPSAARPRASSARPMVFAGGLWTWVGPAPAVGQDASRLVFPPCAPARRTAIRHRGGHRLGRQRRRVPACWQRCTACSLYAEYNYTGDTGTDLAGRAFSLPARAKPAAPFALHGASSTRPPGVVPRERRPRQRRPSFCCTRTRLIPLYARRHAGHVRFSGFYADLARNDLPPSAARPAGL